MRLNQETIEDIITETCENQADTIDLSGCVFAEVPGILRLVLLVKHLSESPEPGRTEVFKNEAIDILVGGTPCQSFSVAGLRKGLDDPRGNLALVYLGIADKARPRWIVWENVPGVLSSNEGRDFGAFLGGLAELGYGFAYRVLEAQYFGVPQRRRRVFVVGYLGDWRPAAKVLFEFHSLQGHNPPSREKRQGSSPCFTTSPDGSGKLDEGTPTLDARAKDGPRRNQGGTIISHTVTSKWSKNNGGPAGHECQNLVPFAIKTSITKQNGTPISKDKAHTLDCAGPQAVAFTQNTRDEVRKIGGDGQIAGALGAEEGMKQRTYLAVPQAQVYENHPADSRMKECGDVAPTVTSRFGTGGGNVPIVNEPKAFTPAEARRSGTIKPQDTSPTLTSQTKHGDTMPCVAVAPSLTASNNPSRSPQSSEVTQQVGAVHSASMQVRRLTPRECERLQGFPDDYTLIPFRGKPASDGPRYKSLGNSMARPVMEWIGERIKIVDSELSAVKA